MRMCNRMKDGITTPSRIRCTASNRLSRNGLSRAARYLWTRCYPGLTNHQKMQSIRILGRYGEARLLLVSDPGVKPVRCRVALCRQSKVSREYRLAGLMGMRWWMDDDGSVTADEIRSYEGWD